MGEILKAGGASYSSVVKTTIMYEFLALCSWSLLHFGNVTSFWGFISCRLADLKDFKKVNEIYAKCEFCIVNFVDNVSLTVYILVEGEA